MATKFCMVASRICGPSVWILLHVTHLASRIFKVVPRLLENLCTSLYLFTVLFPTCLDFTLP